MSHDIPRAVRDIPHAFDDMRLPPALAESSRPLFDALGLELRDAMIDDPFIPDKNRSRTVARRARPSKSSCRAWRTGCRGSRNPWQYVQQALDGRPGLDAAPRLPVILTGGGEVPPTSPAAAVASPPREPSCLEDSGCRPRSLMPTKRRWSTRTGEVVRGRAAIRGALLPGPGQAGRFPRRDQDQTTRGLYW